jgi:hypothetical protein
MPSHRRFEDQKEPGRHFRIEPTRFRSILTEAEHHSVALPHFLLVLVSTALTSRESAPICIILPSTEGVAQVLSVLASVECLAAGWEGACRNFVERQLKPGTRVRSLPDGYVYQVAGKRSYNGIELLTLNYIDKGNVGARVATRFRSVTRSDMSLRSGSVRSPARAVK